MYEWEVVPLLIIAGVLVMMTGAQIVLWCCSLATAEE
jgi:hypothetical protein